MGESNENLKNNLSHFYFLKSEHFEQNGDYIVVTNVYRFLCAMWGK